MTAKEMLINTVQGRECRIAIVENGVLEELYIERASSASHVGNIYKGRVTNIEPAIQAAFVDFGLNKNGFLHISDVHPKYFPKGTKATESVGAKQPRHERPAIQKCLRRGQEVVVQITKEGIGTKGPTLTTYLSLPGRLLVMMPGMSRLGVSKKVEDEDARAKARQLLSQLKLPPDIGFIVRTAGMDQSKRELQRDLNYLLRLWQAVELRTRSSRVPAEIYQESDLVIRTIRDVYNTDVNRIVCDNKEIAFKVREFLNMAMPRTKNTIDFYVGKGGLFYDYGLEEEIEKIYARRVALPSGGSLVIDQAEALVAIDVNSGRYREHDNAVMTALKTDLEAAKEVIRQLRLRDMGGVIVIDFIDLREDKHRRQVERVLRDALKKDRAKTKMLRMSPFGIVEMTRQRVRPSLEHSMHAFCKQCGGAGFLKSEESQALHVMRCLQRASADENTAKIEAAVTPSVAHYLANVERSRLYRLEQETGKRIIVRADAALAGNDVRLTCTDRRGTIISCEALSGESTKSKLQTVNIEKLPTPGEEKRRAVDQAREPQQAPAETKDRDKPAQAAKGPEADRAEPEVREKKKRRRGRRGGKKHKRAKAGAAQPPK